MPEKKLVKKNVAITCRENRFRCAPHHKNKILTPKKTAAPPPPFQVKSMVPKNIIERSCRQNGLVLFYTFYSSYISNFNTQ